jgi:uncharacterized surface protein with fasciclin (FAS1) repeats
MKYDPLRLGKGLAAIGLGAIVIGLGQSSAMAQTARRQFPREHPPVYQEIARRSHAPANMLEAIEQNGNLKGFVELLQIAGLQEYVKTAPITVFAPQDPACSALLQQARTWKQQNNHAKLAGLRTAVKHHLLAGKYMWRPGGQQDIKQLQGDTTEMTSGFRLAVFPTNTGTSFTLQVSNSRRARVIRADLVEPNGVLFIIDRVLDAHSVGID